MKKQVPSKSLVIPAAVVGRKVPVTPRALFQRVARALRKKDEMLKTCRADSRVYHDLGAYYTIDGRTGMLCEKDISLEALGRELGVLKVYEELRDES